ncbi:hypothetical protein [Moraxella catarrhalis]|uniref:hypothetical protein n=1 Tax=Moraxella catarrhalis TaxID=480 RepID=UPI00128E0C8D|nr:hypothetical protein [Moraxella catarrhalis]MPY08828.1 hypothetical protein [Moraxella catarrhalis]
MTTHTILETAQDVIELVTEWHENNQWLLSQRIAHTENFEVAQELQTIKELYSELPFEILFISKVDE